MFYTIGTQELTPVPGTQWLAGDGGVGTCTTDEWEELPAWLRCAAQHQSGAIHFCKLERYPRYLMGTLHVPAKRQPGQHLVLAFYMFDGHLLFWDDSGTVENFLQRQLAQPLRGRLSAGRVLCEFLLWLVDEDLTYLEEQESRIEDLEEAVLAGERKQLGAEILAVKKETSHLYRYYSHLTDIGQRLQESCGSFFEAEDSTIFGLFADRAARLQSETQVQREYAAQVQELYQAQIGIRQNDIMKVLTIVTTIFLPLTLIAGWYGMNFLHMPELSWKYGYPAVIFVSILVVAGCICLFKSRKFW